MPKAVHVELHSVGSDIIQVQGWSLEELVQWVLLNIIPLVHALFMIIRSMFHILESYIYTV